MSALFPNIECRNKGAKHQDKTADPEISYEVAHVEAEIVHARLFDDCDLTEILQDVAHLLLHAVKAGDAEAVGKTICEAYKARVNDRATWSLQ